MGMLELGGFEMIASSGSFLAMGLWANYLTICVSVSHKMGMKAVHIQKLVKD